MGPRFERVFASGNVDYAHVARDEWRDAVESDWREGLVSRTIAPLVWLATLVAMLLAGCGKSERPAPVAPAAAFSRAPVIVISIDTLRSDRLPAYGYTKVETPAIDAFRAESILFERAYSPSPMTLPSHLSMLSGMLPATHGVRNNIGYTFDESKHFYLPCHLRQAGYATGAAVSTYVLRSESGASACFDFFEDAIDPRGSAARFTSQQRPGEGTLAVSLPWIAAHASEPFFFLFHIYEPHAPYEPIEPFLSRYADAYDGEVATADAIVGRFLDGLRANGVLDRAIVILTSDHGEGLGDHGEEQHSVLLHRELIQVPLMIRLPGAARAGETITSPVQLTDLVPTVLDLLGRRVDDAFEGDALLSGAIPPDRPIFAETLYPRIHLGWSDLASLIVGPHHLIDGPRPELYNLVADPGETNDLAAAERRTLASLRAAIAPFRVPMQPLEAIDPEAARQLSALGYVGSPASREGPLPDPKEKLRDLETIRGALLAARDGRTAEAERTLRELVAASPRMAEGWAKLAEVLTMAGDDAGAVDAWRQALSVSPIKPPDLVLDAGHAALRAGRHDEALSLANAAKVSVPTRAWDLEARVEIARGRFAEAERAARRALHEPMQPPDQVLLATTIQRQGRFGEALAILDDAERTARSGGTWPVLGLDALRADTYARTEEIEKAKAAYQREIESFPANLDAWSRYAILVFLEDGLPEVERLLERMARANPGPAARIKAATTLDLLEQHEAAARWRRMQ